MVASTRSSPVKIKAKAIDTPLVVQSSEPLKLFIIPQETTPTARFLLLDHPRDNTKSRFFFCPKKGLYGFTKIAAPSIDPSSILFAASLADEQYDEDNLARKVETDIAAGYVNKAAEFCVAAPFDLSFILLPILAGTKGSSGKTLFQPLDDMLEDHLRNNRHLSYIFQNGRTHIDSAVERFCDSIDAGDEKLYRLSESRVLLDILARAQRAVTNGLPPSLEEKFVTRGLERPMLSIKREESSVTAISDIDGDKESSSGSFDSHSTVVSSAASAIFSDLSSTSTIAAFVEDAVPLDIRQLQRLRTAFKFITSSYLPINFADRLGNMLESNDSPLDFSPLNEHLKMLAQLRAEAFASRSVTDFSRKRGNIEDDEEAELRAEKKRKVEEEEKRKKAGESRGVRNLKKANIGGMQKLSNFFTKKPPASGAKA